MVAKTFRMDDLRIDANESPERPDRDYNIYQHPLVIKAQDAVMFACPTNRSKQATLNLLINRFTTDIWASMEPHTIPSGIFCLSNWHYVLDIMVTTYFYQHTEVVSMFANEARKLVCSPINTEDDCCIRAFQHLAIVVAKIKCMLHFGYAPQALLLSPLQAERYIALAVRDRTSAILHRPKE